MRRSRTDNNQKQIVNALRRCGISVVDLSSVGGGCPDILIGWQGKNYLIEIKNKETRYKVQPNQKEFHDKWRGEPILVAYSLDDVFKLLNINQKP